MILLDRAYAMGFAWAAYKSGDLLVRQGSEEKVGPLEKAVHDHIQPREASRRTKAALELATIHDSVLLHALPAGYHFTMDRLVREGVVHGVAAVGAISDDRHWPAGYVEQRLAGAMRNLVRYCRSVLRVYAPQELPLLTTRAVRLLAEMLYRALDASNVNDGHSLTILYRSFHQKELQPPVGSREYVSVVIGAGSALTGLSEYSVTLLVIGLMSHIMSVMTLDGISASEAAPYVSDIHSKRFVNTAGQPPSLHDAYELCCIAMREVVEYAPVVESVDDMLRLREDRRIGGFREALKRWSSALQRGELDVLGEIRREVSARNRELQRLHAWRRVDEWLYWSALPLAAIPIVSTIHTVVSVGVRWNIERTTNSNWLCLGQ